MLLNLEPLLDDFLVVIGHLKIEITRDDIHVETLQMPHEPTDLPPGKVAVYIFSSQERVLKVGRVGPNSQARYKYQHYTPGSSSSNLSDSLLKDKNAVQKYGLNKKNVGTWIKNNTDRVNLLLNAKFSGSALSFLELIAQHSLHPVYEGHG